MARNDGPDAAATSDASGNGASGAAAKYLDQDLPCAARGFSRSWQARREPGGGDHLVPLVTQSHPNIANGCMIAAVSASWLLVFLLLRS
jgi:hypothetical protein